MRLASTCPDVKAESSDATVKASTGRQSGHCWALRTWGSWRRQSQSSVRQISEPSASVIESPSPTTNAARRPRRSAITSVRVPVEEHPEERHADDLEVEREGPALDVFDVVLDALLERGIAAEPVDLRPAGDTRLHLVAQHVAGHGLPEPLDEDRSLGARPDDAHLPTQDIHELRQLVQAEAAQES